MSISTDSWTTVQLSRSHLQASLDFQKAFIDNKESKKSMSELNKFFAEEVSDTIQELVLASLFSLSTVFVTFLENDIWIKAHFVRAGQALHTQRRIWYIYHRQLAPKGGVVYERPNFVGYRTTFCGTNITIG